jgi:hypothetical protein
MTYYLSIYGLAAIALTSAMLYLTYRLLRIARRSLLSKMLYDLLIVVILVWFHSLAIVSLLISVPGWQSLYAFVYILMPIASLYFLWDVLRYVREKEKQKKIT